MAPERSGGAEAAVPAARRGPARARAVARGRGDPRRARLIGGGRDTRRSALGPARRLVDRGGSALPRKPGDRLLGRLLGPRLARPGARARGRARSAVEPRAARRRAVGARSRRAPRGRPTRARIAAPAPEAGRGARLRPPDRCGGAADRAAADRDPGRRRDWPRRRDRAPAPLRLAAAPARGGRPAQVAVARTRPPAARSPPREERRVGPVLDRDAAGRGDRCVDARRPRSRRCGRARSRDVGAGARRARSVRPGSARTATRQRAARHCSARCVRAARERPRGALHASRRAWPHPARRRPARI